MLDWPAGRLVSRHVHPKATQTRLTAKKTTSQISQSRPSPSHCGKTHAEKAAMTCKSDLAKLLYVSATDENLGIVLGDDLG